MEFRTSIPKTIGLACLGIVMVAVSYFAATHASGYKMVLAWFGVPFFTLGVVLICVQLFRRGPKMGSVPLEWSDIAAVSVGQIRRQKFLCLWLRDQDAYVARLPAARRFAAKGNIALGFPATSLSFSGLEPGLEQALEYALKYVPQRANG
jgi:hypothetical protein